jgi:hypothetical protein
LGVPLVGALVGLEREQVALALVGPAPALVELAPVVGLALAVEVEEAVVVVEPLMVVSLEQSQGVQPWVVLPRVESRQEE